MDIKKATLNLMLANRRIFENHQYTVPSPTSYPFQWLWDSCFHAIILRHFSPEDAKAELLSLVSKQFDDGMIPHIICWDKKIISTTPKDSYLNKIVWGKEGTSSITQPPMIAFAALQIYQVDKDKNFLKQIYPAINNFCHYLLKERDPHGKNLIGIINPDESGEDNSPRFDSALGLPTKHTLDENFQKRLTLVEENKRCNFDAPNCMRNFFWVKDVPFNSIFVENLRATSEIAAVLGLTDDYNFFKKKAQTVVDAMREMMFEGGIFWSTLGTEYVKIKIITWAIFAPLFAGIPTKDEAKNLIENHLLNNDEFRLNNLCPTVSKNEPSFDPEGFWRGPTWMATNWFIYKGLINYGFNDEADMILQSSLKLLEKSGFREYYNPNTGDGLGAKNFTWGGLVLDMYED